MRIYSYLETAKKHWETKGETAFHHSNHPPGIPSLRPPWGALAGPLRVAQIASNHLQFGCPGVVNLLSLKDRAICTICANDSAIVGAVFAF